MKAKELKISLHRIINGDVEFGKQINESMFMLAEFRMNIQPSPTSFTIACILEGAIASRQSGFVSREEYLATCADFWDQQDNSKDVEVNLVETTETIQ